MTELIFFFTFAVLNRARGSKFFKLVKSTQVARIMAAMGMATLAMYFADQPKLTFTIAAIGFFLWSLPAWGKYAGMAVGTDSSDEKETVWIDKILDRFKLPFQLEGAIGLSLRMLYAAPVLFVISFVEGGAYWTGLLTPLMGALYYVTGLIWGKEGWKYGEYVSGGLLGLLTFWSL